MNLKFLRSFGVGLVLAATVAASARASLIGDTITATHYFPSIPSNPYPVGNLVVVAGPSDTGSYPLYYSFNPEASSLLVNFVRDFTWASVPFHGLVVTGVDDTIAGFSVTTNVAGWDDSRITFDAHSISANWQGLAVTTQSFVTINLALAPTNTPDNGAAVGFLAFSLLAVATLRRRLTEARSA